MELVSLHRFSPILSSVGQSQPLLLNRWYLVCSSLVENRTERIFSSCFFLTCGVARVLWLMGILWDIEKFGSSKISSCRVSETKTFGGSLGLVLSAWLDCDGIIFQCFLIATDFLFSLVGWNYSERLASPICFAGMPRCTVHVVRSSYTKLSSEFRANSTGHTRTWGRDGYETIFWTKIH